MYWENFLACSLRMTLLGLLSLAGISVVLLVGGVYLSKFRFFHRAVLLEVQATQQGYTTRVYSPILIGQQGVAHTPLHPAGKVLIQGIRYDAKTSGDYVAVGVAVVVTSVEGTSITVQPIAQGQADSLT